MYEEFLAPKGLKYEDLTEAEKKTLFQMVDSLKQREMTIEKLKDSLEVMRDAVSFELENEPEYYWVFIFKFENRKQIFLKARLRNYRILIAMLESPAKARMAIDHALSNVNKK